jgi:murein L,D-transpeptidase YcbB/YkuD
MMEHMVVNPTWNVPRSITVKEYLPMLQKNPNSVEHLKITDRRGRVVDRSEVDFTQFTASNFPFAMSQAPSNSNALGLVKFMFPNKWNIYLHDTPSKSLFKKEVRAFSHGCIRLGKPFDLAYTLLARQSDDPQAEFRRYLNTGRETTVPLEQPIPVHLVYFTAWPSARGEIEYRRDVYGRDARVFDALVAAGVAMPELQG